MKTLYAVAQIPVHYTDQPFVKFGFIMADSWQQAQAAAGIYWQDVPAHRTENGFIEGTRTLAYDVPAMLANLQRWSVPLDLLDLTLPAEADPLPADYCRHCADKGCPPPCFLEEK